MKIELNDMEVVLLKEALTIILNSQNIQYQIEAIYLDIAKGLETLQSIIQKLESKNKEQL